MSKFRLSVGQWHEVSEFWVPSSLSRLGNGMKLSRSVTARCEPGGIPPATIHSPSGADRHTPAGCVEGSQGRTPGEWRRGGSFQHDKNSLTLALSQPGEGTSDPSELKAIAQFTAPSFSLPHDDKMFLSEHDVEERFHGCRLASRNFRGGSIDLNPVSSITFSGIERLVRLFH